MYLNRLVNSITVIPEIDNLSDNVNRLYNIGGTLYFNGSEIGTGAGAAANDWVNANDYATYDTVTANIFNTWKTVNTSIDVVQSNLSSEVSTLTANDYNSYTTLKSLIDTIQDNVGSSISSDSILPNSDNTGYVGNVSLAWGEGWFYDLHVSNHATIASQLTVEGNLIVTGNVVTVNATELSIEDNMIYLNANSTITNPDLGFAGNYNDGSYAHAGFFRDATDGYWKVFEGYTPEPDASPYINTAHESFTLSVFQAREFRGNLVASIASVNSVNILANDYNTYTTLASNDGATLLTARSNDYNTYTTLSSNDGATLLTARSNDYGTYVTLTANDFSTYSTLNSRINLVQSNLDSFSGGGVWTEDTGRAYYVGKVVVNSSSAQTEQFYVNGNAKVSSDFEVGGTLTESSSVTLKENIIPLEEQLNKILMLRPVEYDKIGTKSHEYGLIAEEVANVIPQVVSEGSTSIQYTRLIPLLIKAIQELTDRINILESK